MRVVDGDGVEVAAGQPGEIQIAGPNVMKGYWNLPDATAAAISPEGWFATGDIGTRRHRRLLLHRGPQEGPDHPRRLQRLPPRGRGGRLRAPRRGRGRRHRHPTRQPRRGDRRCGRAETRRERRPRRDRRFVRDRVAAYKYPRHIWLLDTLPKGPTGKILRREVTIPTFEPGSTRP